MAKSKSTTTPTKASSSKTKDKDHTGGHRSSRTNVSTRSASAQSSPSKRKADDHTGGSRSSKRRAVADDDATSSTSQRAIPVRPARSKGKGKEVAKSGLELFKERHNSLFPRGVTVKRETPEPEPDADADADNICVRAPSGIDPDDREKLLDFVLIEEFGCEARCHAVDQLFQAARRSAASETDFGVPYIEATVSRLKRKGIKEQRLTEVLYHGARRPLRTGSCSRCLFWWTTVTTVAFVFATRSRTSGREDDDWYKFEQCERCVWVASVSEITCRCLTQWQAEIRQI
jgi:hypothetical protein